MNNKGVTLVELIIYIVLFGIISVLIGSQMLSMMKSYSGGRQASTVQSESRDVITMLAREIRNTGYKTYLTPAAGGHLQRNPPAFGSYLAVDSSSFEQHESSPGTFSDTLIIYKAAVDDQGAFAGVIDTISYYLSGSSLYREKSAVLTELASNVTALQFKFGVFSLDTSLLDQNPIVVNDWTPSAGCTDAPSDTSMQVTVSGALSGTVACKKQFTISTTERIAVSFVVAGQNGFPQNLKYSKWTIRSPANALIASDSFLPRNGPNTIIIPSDSVANGHLTLEFQSTGSGVFMVSSVEVRRKDVGRYIWKDNPPTIEKKAVKAIKIFMLTRSSSKANTTSSSPINVGNISVPRSGPYVWRYYEETVEIPNNGLF